MRSLLVIFTAVCLVMAFNALASDIRLGGLASTDAGTTNSLAVSPLTTVTVQCATPACYKTGTSTLTAEVSCTQSYNLPLVGAKYERTLDTGAHNKIAARALDGGDPNCNVYQTTKNP